MAGLTALGALLGPLLACGDGGPCGPLAPLCDDPGRTRSVAVRVQDAVMLDFDGDGKDEAVVLSRDNRQLTLGYADDWRSSIYLDSDPVGIEALPGEVAVALAEPARRIEVFAVDAEGRLDRRRTLPLRSAPMALRAADLAGDGAPELIASLSGASQLAVVDPVTGATQHYAAGSGASELAIGDVDGDARLDVVVVDAFAGALQVLRGTGDGRLLQAEPSPSSPGTRWLELADHDGDGDLDAVARDEATSVLVHHNEGGRFSSPVALPIAGEAPTGAGLAVGPPAKNGLVGVVVPAGLQLRTLFGKGAAFLGNSERWLREPSEWVGTDRSGSVLVGGNPSLTRFTWGSSASAIQTWRGEQVGEWIGSGTVATGHLDGDHLIDVAVTIGDSLHLLRGRADLELERIAQFELEAYATSVVIADVTGDGQPEVIVGDDVRAQAFFRGDDGQFVAGPGVAPSVAPLTLVSLRTGPGQPRVIAAIPDREYDLSQTPGASLLRFAEDGAVTVVEFADGLYVDKLIAVDFDEDGVDEPLILGRRDETRVLTRMTPAGDGFAPGVEHDLAALSGVALEIDDFAQLAAADVDGDGDGEMFVDAPGGHLRIEGIADDAPQATLANQLSPTTVRDVDGDGLLDLVYLLGDNFFYHSGLGGGTFATERRGHRMMATKAMTFADDPASQFDIVAVGHGISTHLTRDTMSLVGASGSFEFHGDVSRFIRADLDLDGIDDLVTLGASGGAAALWGSETDPLGRGEGIATDATAFGDLDGDGRPELLSGEWGVLFAYRGFPGRQEPEVVFEVFQRPVRLEVADIDADTRPDLVALRYEDDDRLALAVAHGTAVPLRFDPWQTIATVSEYQFASLQLGDVDRDGDLDILVDPEEAPSVLVRGLGGRAWAEPEALPGERTLFSRADARGRVDLLTQEGPTIHRHVDGDPAHRSPLVTIDEAALLTAADADGDGRYDLAVADGKQLFVWLLGDGDPRRVQIPLEAPLAAIAVDFPDIDGDGRPDLVALGKFGGLLVRCSRAHAPDPAP
ncbi:FG-GAP repeat domain-containing protein [Nannocystis bainbridge]|uniref:VCBS repeat-containing protein n=1 Tax=Nannocystis bainbridge TaxID=2995303 RepID=A0ABT5E5D0_9BACT|nr:VCBS repeat-containing protein [Nannocystis bainbridge]MDC0721072.1 VCBS repeat-containing protein [Nannocystis bainbridge]